ncbi:uncharacterized protein A4U43_C03F24860 [Asparagus officinalis]|uniref:Uncharacterized protein n=1 Tax=Asparagus officinalis TaxID=4686 RepID=A0A5P1FFK8_ASPOF|nr:uncharacterized protein A4U43_C03F24860 [Asparagus officinalis]
MMGSPFSKKPNPPLNGSNREDGSSSNSSDMGSHEAGNHQDPELQNLNSILQQRTIGAISMLMSSEPNSISFDSFRQITGCLLDNNHEVVSIILEHKKDVWKNPELFDLVQEYFANSLQTLDFCSSLEKCLKRARDSQLIIQLALRRFEEEEQSSKEEGNGKKKYERTLEELQHFKAAGDPFTEEFFRVFQSVCMKQFSMFEKLKKKKEKLDRKLRSVKAWTRVSSVIFVSAFATVLICSVVAAVMAAPPVALLLL